MPKKRRSYAAKDLDEMPVSEITDEENPSGEADVGQMPRTRGRPRDADSVEGRDEVEPGFTTTGPSGSSGGRALYGMGDIAHHKRTDIEDDDTEP